MDSVGGWVSVVDLTRWVGHGHIAALKYMSSLNGDWVGKVSMQV